MTRASTRAPDRRARARRRRPRGLAVWGVRLAAVLLTFAVGVAIGRALRDNPETGRERTYVRTLRPGAVPPPPRTVTVTVESG